jgi:Domain of unknown function (DUF6429)
MVYYCEQAAGFCRDVDCQDAAYCDALVRMFEQALRTTTDAVNSGTVRNHLLASLDHVRSIGHELGYGIGDDMDVLFPDLYHLLGGGCFMEIDEEKVDEAVLALLYLTTFKDKPRWRAWKGHSWDVLDRLHQKGYISDPATKAKSVLLSEEGAQRSRDLFEKYFAK